MPRAGADLIAQGGANCYGSDKTGFKRVIDAGANINLVESGMALYGIQPVGIGVGSALFQYSIADGYKSPLNNTLTWQAFRAQALIGTTGGYLGKGAGHFLTPNLSAGLFYHSFLRGGPRLARPVWLGSRALFQTVPHVIGITEEHLENRAEKQYPVKKTPVDSTATGTVPADSLPTIPPNLPPPADKPAPYHFKMLPL